MGEQDGSCKLAIIYTRCDIKWQLSRKTMSSGFLEIFFQVEVMHDKLVGGGTGKISSKKR